MFEVLHALMQEEEKRRDVTSHLGVHSGFSELPCPLSCLSGDLQDLPQDAFSHSEPISVCLPELEDGGSFVDLHDPKASGMLWTHMSSPQYLSR